MAEPRTFETEIEIDAPVESVWKALTEADELTRWFPLEAKVNPGVGGSVEMSWTKYSVWDSRIEIWEPNRPPPFRRRSQIRRRIRQGRDAADLGLHPRSEGRKNSPSPRSLRIPIRTRLGQRVLRIFPSRLGFRASRTQALPRAARRRASRGRMGESRLSNLFRRSLGTAYGT